MWINSRFRADQEILVGTTRPETIFGDVAIAVHPEDPRYCGMKDTFAYHPVRKCPIPVVFDEAVDPKIATGNF